MLALVRTSLSFIGFGILIAKLLPDLQIAWLAPTLGSLLIAAGAGLALVGFRSTHDVITKLHEEGVKEPRWLVTGTMLLLLVTAAVPFSPDIASLLYRRRYRQQLEAIVDDMSRIQEQEDAYLSPETLKAAEEPLRPRPRQTELEK